MGGLAAAICGSLGHQLGQSVTSAIWGIAGTLADFGAGLIGLNPLHALFPWSPEAASPYSPTDRIRLNVLMIDVTALPEYAECAEVRVKVESAENSNRASRSCAPRKWSITRGRRGEVAGAVEVAVLQRSGPRVVRACARIRALVRLRWRTRKLALYDAIQLQMRAEDPSRWGWPAWPEPLRDSRLAEVSRFEHEHADEVGYHLWLQWHADVQLSAAAEKRTRAACRSGCIATSRSECRPVAPRRGRIQTLTRWICAPARRRMISIRRRRTGAYRHGSRHS